MPFEEIIIRPELSSPPRFRILGGQLERDAYIVVVVAGRYFSFLIWITSHFTYNLSLMATTTDPYPDNSTTLHSRLVHKDPKTKKVWKTHIIIEKQSKKGFLFFSSSNISDKFFDQKCPAFFFRLSTERTTFLLNRPCRPIQSLSHYVRMSSVCAIAENPLPCGLETSGQRAYC